jgi:hypothetical protein
MKQFNLLILLYLTSTLRAQQSTQRASLYKSEFVGSEKSCASFCLWQEGWDDSLPGELGCGGSLTNDCVCRVDQAPVASSALTKCILKVCGSSSTIDVSRAVSIYDAYCAGAGYTDGHAAVPAITTNMDPPDIPTFTELTIVTETASTGSLNGASLGELKVFGVLPIFFLFV